MITYTYVVKCPNCDEEFFDIFDEAKAFALGCLSQKPIITQTEVNRNDFGECTDHCDLGTVWSWEDAVGMTDDEPAKSIFTKDDLKDYIPDEDPEFQDDGEIEGFLTEAEQKLATNSKGEYLVRASSGLGYTVYNRSNVAIGGFEEDDDNNAITRFRRGNIKEATEEPCRKPVPEGMSLKDLVEAMEENEDTVECVGCEELFPKDECFQKEGIGWLCGDCEDRIVKCGWCEELFDRDECRYEVDLKWLCDRCEAGIKSRGETLTFREGNYWDFLDEKLDLKFDFSNIIDSSDMEIYGVEPIGEDTYKAVLLKRFENVPFNKPGSREEIEKVEREMFDLGGLFVFHFGKDGLPALGRWDPELLNSLGNCEIIFDDEKYDQACERTFNRATSKTESLNGEVSFEDLVKDSINHLTNDLGKDPWAEDFADEVIGDLERNYFTDVPEEFGKYQEWCSAVACEVSRQVNKEN